jgi:hypothetical protein
MKNFLLTKVRLSYYFWFFFFFFVGVSYLVPGTQFDAGALTLFSVNSFLYGFYIAPILGAQKSRVEELHRVVRAESNALFSLMLDTKHLPEEVRNRIQAMVTEYIQQKLHRKVPDAGEKQYEKLITYCLDYRGRKHDDIDGILEAVVANEKNRTDFAMQVGNRVFANEWQIMAILFSITLGFILSVDIGDTFILQVIRALLCTGLTMLIVILVKLSTLTHKKAKQMWLPLHKLLTTNFYRID